MKNVIYIRQSLKKDKQKMSLAVQESTSLSVAKREGFVIHEIYNEGTKSARKTQIEERPELVRLLEDVRAKKIKKLIVFKRDRLARNVEQYLEIIELLQKYNVELFFAADNEPPLFKGSIGFFVESLLAGMAEQEADNIVKRLITSRADMVTKGNSKGRKTPKFYSRDPDGNIYLTPKNKALIKKIYETFLDSSFDSLKEIQNELKKDPSLKNESFKLQDIIGNEMHRGKLVQYFEGVKYEYDGVLNELRAVDDSIWIEAYKKMYHIKPEIFEKGSESKPRTFSPFKSLSFCGSCNKLLKHGYVNFSCKKCRVEVRIEKLEQKVCKIVLQYISSQIQSPNQKNLLLKEIREQHLYPISTQIKTLEESIKKTKGEIRSQLVTLKKYDTKGSLDVLVQSYKEDISKLDDQRQLSSQIKRNIDGIHFNDFRIWKENQLTENQKDVIKRFISKITIQKKLVGKGYELDIVLNKLFQPKEGASN